MTNSLKAFLALSFSGILLPTLAGAEPLVCGACPNGVTEVAVGVVSSDIEESGHAWYMSSRAYLESRRPAGVRDGGIWVIESPEGFRNVFARAAANCQRIKQLTVFTHGSPGRIYFGHRPMDVTNMEQFLEGASCAMADNANVDFSGCNSGRGCRGEDFLQRIAANLLSRGGGTVVANTQYSSTFAPGLITHFSLNLDRQSLTVARGGSSPRWDNTPQTADQCVSRARAALTDLDRISTVHGCGMTESHRSAVSRARDQLTRFIATESSSGYSRVGTDSRHRQAQDSLLYGFWDYEWIQNPDRGLPVCGGSSSTSGGMDGGVAVDAGVPASAGVAD